LSGIILNYRAASALMRRGFSCSFKPLAAEASAVSIGKMRTRPGKIVHPDLLAWSERKGFDGEKQHSKKIKTQYCVNTDVMRHLPLGKYDNEN